jgi:ABC-type Fe3+ transport system permease subunit
LRSQTTVCLGLGFRFLPVALLFGLRSWATMPPSWALAAAVHGVPFASYLVRVVLPHLAPAVAASFLLVALLATADLTTVLLLHPPGASSLPLSIFTVMANARESLVASLCMTYFVLALVVVAVGWSLGRACCSLSSRRGLG